MTEIVNLNKVRKRRAKQKRLETASRNRIKFGLTSQVREAARREQQKQSDRLDATRLPSGTDQKT